MRERSLNLNPYNCVGLKKIGLKMVTKVIFRRWKKTGDVIALFPEVPCTNPYECMSYEHVGQHGAANYDTVMWQTKLAKPEEYAELMAELVELGYDDLVVYERETPQMRAVFKEEYDRQTSAA